MSENDEELQVGRLLRAAREHAQLTQAAAAAALDLRRETLTRLELDQQAPSLKTLRRMAAVYGVDVGFFFPADATTHRIPVREKVLLLLRLYEAGQSKDLFEHVASLTAIAMMPQPPSHEQAQIFRLLAVAHREAGRDIPALAAAERALTILDALGDTAADTRVVLHYGRCRTFQAMGQPAQALQDAYAILSYLPQCSALVAGVGTLEVGRVFAGAGLPPAEWRKLLDRAHTIAARQPDPVPSSGFTISPQGVEHGMAEAVGAALLHNPQDAAVRGLIGYGIDAVQSALAPSAAARGLMAARWLIHAQISQFPLRLVQRPSEAGLILNEAEAMIPTLQQTGSRVLARTLARNLRLIDGQKLTADLQPALTTTTRTLDRIGKPLPL